MRSILLLWTISLPLLMVLATPLMRGSEGQVIPRQISLTPASSCAAGQLWCCQTVGSSSDSAIAAALILAGILDPSGFNNVGVGCSALSWPLNMNCPSPGKQVCCDPDPGLKGEVELDCRAVNPLLR